MMVTRLLYVLYGLYMNINVTRIAAVIVLESLLQVYKSHLRKPIAAKTMVLNTEQSS